MYIESLSLTSADNYLVSLNEVCEYTGIEITDSVTSALQNFTGYISDQFEAYCGQGIKSNSWTGYYDGNGSCRMFTANSPIVSVSSLQYRLSPFESYQDLVSDMSSVILYDNYVELYQNHFPIGKQSIKIIYSAGYEVIPGDIKKCAIEAVAEMYSEMKNDRLGLSTKTINNQPGLNESNTYYQLAERHRYILDNYRKIS
jgi:hypothetical protein